MASKEANAADANAARLCCLLLFLVSFVTPCFAGQIGLGSRMEALDKDRAWVSGNGTFAFGFARLGSTDRFLLGIWYNQLPGDRTIVWSPNRVSPVSKGAKLELDTSGNLVLSDGPTTIWTSNTSNTGVKTAVLSDSGNLLLLGASGAATNNNHPIWQSFSHPSDTLLPNQPLTVSLELTSTESPPPSHGGYYSLKMLQQHTSLSLALTYNLPHGNISSTSYANYSYWAGPEISNVTGDVTAVLDDAGSFKIAYGESSDGAVYVYKNEADGIGLTKPRNSSFVVPILRRLVLEYNGNIRLYRWDNDLNGSSQWVAEWSAVSNPCAIAGVCGNGVCNLDRSKNANCRCLPGTDTVKKNRVGGGNTIQCSDNSSLVRQCKNGNNGNNSNNGNNGFSISAIQDAYYYFSEYSVVANYSDIQTVTKCGDACLSDCDCVASVYGLYDEKAYCWILRSLDFGGFEDPGSTLFVKKRGYGKSSSDGPDENAKKKKLLVIPIVLSLLLLLICLLCLLLYHNLYKKKSLRRAMEKSLILSSGSPVSFTYRDLQIRTNNFSHLLGTGGFGSVYRGNLADGTPVAVKKLEKVLPHGEKEFITEVNTIGSMHHMNLVRLCGYCSEGPYRLLVYEFMKNGSLDNWIFPSSKNRHKHLDWPTRFNIAVATAQGVAYFHEQLRNRVIHCDIKPENILLDENFCPKVSDFGLAKLMGREHSHVVTMVRGTRGYLAPEWVTNRPITVKADVYSYGMLLLEIIGGRRNLDLSFDAQDFFYPGAAFKEMTNGTPMKAVDKRLQGAIDEEEAKKAMKVAFWCIQDEVALRPSMGEVVKLLEGSEGDINMPPMPQTVLELIEEGLEHIYKAMKREFNHVVSSFDVTATTVTEPWSAGSQATCSNSTMSPR